MSSIDSMLHAAVLFDAVDKIAAQQKPESRESRPDIRRVLVAMKALATLLSLESHAADKKADIEWRHWHNAVRHELAALEISDLELALMRLDERTGELEGE